LLETINVDEQRVLKGRKIVEEHALEIENLRNALIRKQRVVVEVSDLRSRLAMLGYRDRAEFDAENIAYETKHYREFLLNKKFKPTKFYLIDGSETDVFEFCAMQELLISMRESDSIGDVVLLRYPIKNDLSLFTPNMASMDPVRRKCTEFKIPYSRMVIPVGGGVHSNRDFAFNLITKSFSFDEAAEFVESILTVILTKHGIEYTHTPKHRLFRVKKLKISGLIGFTSGGVTIYGSGVCFYDDPDLDKFILHRGTTSWKSVGLEIDPNELKNDLIEAFSQLSSILDSTLLSTGGLSIYNLINKFRSADWVVYGER
jgi:hypothetical protein